MPRLDDRLAPLDPEPLIRRVSWFVILLFGLARIPLLPLSILGFGSPGSVLLVTVATVGSVVPWVWILLVGLGAVPPRLLRSAFAVLVVITVGTTFALPAGGLDRQLWSTAFASVAVSALIVFPNGRGVAAAVVAVLAAPIFTAWPDPAAAAASATNNVVRTLAIYLLVSLVAALRRLATGRAELVQQSLAAEQARIDATLRRTVGDELEDLVRHGEALLAGTDSDSELADSLRRLVQRSRRSLAAARRAVQAYQPPTAARELEAAVALLNAAGIAAHLATPPAAPPHLEESERTSFQQEIRRILTASPAPSTCTIAVTDDGTVRVSADPHGPDPTQVR